MINPGVEEGSEEGKEGVAGDGPEGGDGAKVFVEEGHQDKHETRTQLPPQDLKAKGEGEEGVLEALGEHFLSGDGHGFGGKAEEEAAEDEQPESPRPTRHRHRSQQRHP